MKALITKLSIFIAIVLGLHSVFLCYGKPWYETPGYFSVSAKKELIEKKPRGEFDTFVLGDSRALIAFDPEMMEGRACNLAIEGGTPIDGYYLFKKLIQKQSVKKVYISYAPVHFDKCAFMDQLMRLDIFENKDVLEIFSVSRVYNEKFWANGEIGYRDVFDVYMSIAEAILIKFRFPVFYRAAIANVFFEAGRYREDKDTYINTLARAGHYTNYRKGQSDGLSEEAREYKIFLWKKLLRHYMRKMLLLGVRNDIEVVYVTVPLNKTSREALSEKYVYGYDNFWESIKKDFPEVTFKYELGSYDNRFFLDCSHLNKEGTVKFANFLKSQHL